MERYEIGDDERLAAMVAAARRGEEAAFTQDGTVVAVIEPRTSALRTRDGGVPKHEIDWDVLKRLHASLPDSAKGGGAALIREMRDAGY